MTIMIWFDNDKKRTLTEKIERAAAFYARKHGTRPNLCYVPIGTSKGVAIDGMVIEERANVVRGHMQIGVIEC